jgi:outer membrane protein OmpA-like peptidoglycan-associated protein
MKKLPVLIMLVGFLSFAPIGSIWVGTETVAAAIVQQPPDRESEPRGVQVLPGQRLKFAGVIIKREADSFTLRNQAGTHLTVRISDSTTVKEKKSNPFRSARKYSSADLIPGLSVEAEGRGDDSGALVAQEIRFRNDDLLVARTVQTQVVPVKNQLGQVETRLSQTEQNAQRLSGQMEELTEVSNIARGGARAAQETADQAIVGVAKTNERITALDEYVVQNSMTLHFKVGRAELSPEAMALLDEIATEAKTETGFAIEVTGFASADGSEAFNRRLSQRRAEAVIRYLVEEHEIPLRRILMPHGYGELHPVADNSSRQGRQQNRRVEVKLLVNRGLTGPVSVNTSMSETSGSGLPQP